MVYEHAIDHRSLVVQLINENGWKRGVEVGVGTGILARRIQFQCPNIETVFGVDLGVRKEWLNKLYDLADECPKFRLLVSESVKAASLIEDGWADFVFIDAGHTYRAVKADIRAWRSKVRPGGWFGGHDYHEKYPGVIRAVDEAFPKRTLIGQWIWQA